MYMDIEPKEERVLTFPLFVCISGGFATQDSLLLPLFNSWGSTDFLLPEGNID